MASSSSFPDVLGWIQTLPPVSQWQANSMSICICPSNSTQPSLYLSINKNLQNHSSSISCTIIASFNLPITLWTSKSIKIKSHTTKLLDEITIYNVFCNLIQDVLSFGPKKSTSYLYIPSSETIDKFREVFNLSLLTLTFLVCIYEAPQNLRLGYLNTLKNYLTSSKSKEASIILMRLLGSNIEEQWMRSLNLAVTNWIVEFKETNHGVVTPSPLFSYSFSTFRLWKVQLYCPVIAMKLENSSSTSIPERLLFSLLYHQLEGVIQLGCRVVPRAKWIDVGVTVDNIRCDVIKLVSETLISERGAGAVEKHFPSRILLQVTPIIQTNVLSVTVSKSSENPRREIGLETAIEGGFDAPSSFLGFKVSAAETMTMSMKPWKFEQSVYGDTANLNWSLHDNVNGREVFSSKPSKFELVQSKAWFKDRYSSAYRPFTKQGGVIFAGDKYGENVWWKVDRKAMGMTMEWEIKGWIWLTYWPNKYKTVYNETRRLEFRETLKLSL
ncbi:Neuronal pas domain protein [Thalictrum thalictroides]|uniref:Neuronal pas domain protein n=1 Tax=Thalictrum thalictroides TaxID=46969 RepID=A0A7J6WTU3_THATH|nr:Neuronal pas domain protein [Thalictrum thalictroides]